MFVVGFSVHAMQFGRLLPTLALIIDPAHDSPVGEIQGSRHERRQPHWRHRKYSGGDGRGGRGGCAHRERPGGKGPLAHWQASILD